jgi:hypothetical protein
MTQFRVETCENKMRKYLGALISNWWESLQKLLRQKELLERQKNV